MKTQKALKILILAFTAAVLAIGFCFAASATEEASELSVSIIKKNVSYSDYVKVLFAVDDTNAGGNEIELLYYFEDPTVNPNAEVKYGAVYDRGYTDDNGNNFPAFYSAGFPAKEIGNKVYARAHIVGTDVYSEVVRYSVVEYLLERLYVDKATGDKKALYEDLLSYGASAQKVLINGNSDPADDITKFITDYVLVGIEGGTLDGKYDQGIYFVGDTVTPYRDGALGWNVATYDLATDTPATKAVANGAEIAVEGFTVITESENYTPDLTDTANRLLWNEASTVAEYKSAGYIDYWMGSGAPLAIVDGAPYGEASKVLQFSTVENANNQDQLFLRNNVAYANSTVFAFEADFLVNNTAASSYEIRFMNKDLASADRTAYTLYLSVGTDGTGGISGSGFNKVSAPDVAGNWFRLRAEYHDVSDTQFKIMVYFNGKLLATSDPITKAKGTDHASAVLNQILLAATKASVGDMYIDNVKLIHEAPAFAPDFTADATVETYEDDDALNTFRFDNNGTGAVTDGAPYGTASKVYGFTCEAGKETNFRVTNGTPVYNGTDTFVYESDVMIETASAMLIKVEFRGASLGLTMRLTTDSTGAVYLKDNSGATITPIVPGAEWFRLRIEAKGSTVNFFINDIQVGESQSITINGETVNRLRFYVDQGSGNLYFDNTKVLFVSN